ncbi:MAG: hypothetical protein M0016_07020 [Deltaproteobacteria bacterium]|jgi:hypothetical protein|nr:hypothetical protein [Deltaproteobacteria bacterium]MCL5880592.1 hypothetical protein [Deltaproteobacteria bacterium]MDA8304897.1 hypothetical protein [Deltaproteobacteria bacterium]
MRFKNAINCINYLNDYSIMVMARLQSSIYEEKFTKGGLKLKMKWGKGGSKSILFLSSFVFGSVLSLSSKALAMINLNQGSLGIGASGILNEATTWICYRLAPATLTIGLVKGFYDIKQHKPDAARKAFITAAAGTGVMLAPTITGAILGIVQSAGGSTNGINIGGGNGSTTVGRP